MTVHYNDILQRLRHKMEKLFPQNHVYAVSLSEMLDVSVRTVHRKLSGETQFTASEISRICDFFQFPVADIMSPSPDLFKHPMELIVEDYRTTPSEYHQRIQRSVDCFELAAKSSFSRVGFAYNHIPDVLLIGYEWMSRFAYLKWLYFNKGAGQYGGMQQFVLSEKARSIRKLYREKLSELDQSVHVIHIDFIKIFLQDVRFFYKMDYLTPEDVRKLLSEMEDLIGTGMEYIRRGKLSTGHKVEVYFNEFYLYNNLFLLESDHMSYFMLYVQYANMVLSKNRDTFNLLHAWFMAWVKSSTQISISGDAPRAYFAARQLDAIADFRRELGG